MNFPLTDEQLRTAPIPNTYDNTLRCQANQCLRKFYWFQRGYDYSTRPAYFTWGSAWHEMLRVWYTTPKEPSPASDSWKAALVKAVMAGEEFWDNEDSEETGVNKRSTLSVIFHAYAMTFPTEPWELVEQGAELGWVWPIVGTNYYLAGSIDLYINWPGYGLCSMENKSVGSYLSDSETGKWDLSSQITGYIWYTTQLHGPDSHGCLVNMATKNVPGPRSNWTTPRFARSLQTRSEFQLDTFIQEVLWDISLIEKAYDSWHWPRTPDLLNCYGGQGKAPCLFRNLCLLDADFTQLDPLIYQGIATREEAWEPWKRKGKD